MSENNRDSNRIGLVIDIKLTVEGADHVHKTRNISDNGVFLEHNTPHLNLELGTHVILQVCSMLGDTPAPPVNAEVARITDEGIGLQFIL
ncbi:MAG: PilZ domain-containing protein [Woeseiaceae bacterium]